MRLLHLCPRYPPATGGSERYVWALSEGLARAGHEVTVLTTDAVDPGAIYDARLGHHAEAETSAGRARVLRFPVPESGPRHALLGERLGARPSFACEGLLDRVERIERGELDVVHAVCFPFANLLHAAQTAARRAHCPWVLTPFQHTHSLVAHHFQTQALREAALRADRVLCQTRHEASFFAAWGVLPDRIAVLGLAIEPPPEPGDGRRFRARRGIESGPIVAHIATNDRLKGSEAILEAAARSAGDGVHFVISGNRTGPLDRRLADMKPRERRNVHVLGVIDEAEKHDLLDAMTCLAVPSVVESFGLAYLEAWSYAKPVIAADYGAPAELVSDGQDGLLVPFGDAAALVRAVHTYVEDPERCAAHGAAGRAKLVAMGTWEDKVRAVGAICEELAGSAPSPG